MKRVIGWSVSWALFWMGDFVSKPMHFTWPRESGWPWGHLYPLYNKLMTLSLAVQDWGGDYGPWEPPA